MAATGAMIQHTPAWFFFAIVALGHVIAGAIVFASSFSDAALIEENDPQEPPLDQPTRSTRPADEAVARRYKLALWLSRIALPSTYVIIYSLAPALPSLHAIKQLSPTIATLVASIWLIARTAAFVFLGMTTFWHKRPLLMLAASIAMLFAFLGVIIPGASQIGLPSALLAMAAAQIVLGISIGAIYSSSLYFGMEMSDGSTEHGGYHEALIGLGQILGPAVGASMQWIRPGDLWLSVAGISAVVAISIALEVVMGIRISSGKPKAFQ
jgi:MFS family permease